MIAMPVRSTSLIIELLSTDAESIPFRDAAAAPSSKAGSVAQDAQAANTKTDANDKETCLNIILIFSLLLFCFMTNAEMNEHKTSQP